MSTFQKMSIGFALASVGACSPVLEQREFAEAKPVCQLAVPGLKESSGIAPSFDRPGWFYTHNDDDETLRYWRFNLQGAVEGPFRLVGMPNRDVEDMASARIDGRSYLYFADVGDNGAVFPAIRIVRCLEPSAKAGDQRRFDSFEATYEDGPKNAEAFFVQPGTGDFWIVQKHQDGAGVYVCRGPKPGKGNVFKKVGTLKFPGAIPAMRLVTGGAASMDGKHVALRTYLKGYEFPVGAEFSDWHKSQPVEVKIAIEGQGEAIGYSLDAKSLVTTTEGVPCMVSSVEVKR